MREKEVPLLNSDTDLIAHLMLAPGGNIIQHINLDSDFAQQGSQ